MHISFRIIGILFFLFMAISFDFRNGELRFEMLTGVCENYDFSMQKCASGENLSTVSLLPLFFDPPSILLISVITFLGSAFRGLGVVGSLDKASHLAKDVGELGAAIGAIHTFMGVLMKLPFRKHLALYFQPTLRGLAFL